MQKSAFPDSQLFFFAFFSGSRINEAFPVFILQHMLNIQWNPLKWAFILLQLFDLPYFWWNKMDIDHLWPLSIN